MKININTVTLELYGELTQRIFEQVLLADLADENGNQLHTAIAKIAHRGKLHFLLQLPDGSLRRDTVTGQLDPGRREYPYDTDRTDALMASIPHIYLR